MESLIIERGNVEQVDVKPAGPEVPAPERHAPADYDRVVERLQLEPADSTRSDATPMTRLRAVATRHATAIWGQDIACGEPLQLVGEDDEPVVYAFPCAIGRREIPTTRELIEQFAQLNRAAGPEDERTGGTATSLPHAVVQEATRYGTIYVSARTSDYPVTRVTHALHPYYYRGEQALNSAGDSRMSRLRFLPPYEFFEIQERDSISRLHTDTLMSEDQVREATPVRDLPVDRTAASREARADSAGQKEAAWEAYEQADAPDKAGRPLPFPPPPPPPSYEFLIRYWERMPPINWTRWCEPTAACMVFAYWDHYVPVPGIGTHVGYERIVDYWYDHVSNGNNVPDIMDPIADGPNIDVANVLKGYQHWTVDKVWGTPNNDWAWNALVGHLHRHMPLVWQVHAPNFDHAVAVFGYRIVLGQRYVCLYTTWSDDPGIARAEWLYNEYAGNAMSCVEVDRYVPGGRESYRAMFLYRPYGGETHHVNQWNLIQFYVHPQSDIKIARIEYSLDGGCTWRLVVELWAQPNWNRWWWKPRTASNKARIRVRCMSQSRKYLAGDGSFRNFTIG